MTRRVGVGGFGVSVGQTLTSHKGTLRVGRKRPGRTPRSIVGGRETVNPVTGPLISITGEGGTDPGREGVGRRIN